MDNPIDNPLDLGLVNYTKHPTNPDYIVYRFADAERAASFAEALENAGIEYESDTVQKKTVTYTLFGIHKNDYKKTEKLNFLVEAKHKKPLIPFSAFRWFLILISALAMTLAVVGYCKQQEKLGSLNNPSTTIDADTNGLESEQ